MQLIKNFHLIHALTANLDGQQKAEFNKLCDTETIHPSFDSDSGRTERLVELMRDAGVICGAQLFFQPLLPLVRVAEKKENVKDQSASFTNTFADVSDRRSQEKKRRDVHSTSLNAYGASAEIYYDDLVDPDQLCIGAIQITKLDQHKRCPLGWRLDAAAYDFIHQLMNTYEMTAEAIGLDAVNMYVVTTYRELSLLSEVAINQEPVIKYLAENFHLK